jgi:hypothetical protein
MTDKQIYVYGKIVRGLINAMGMQAQNMQREHEGNSMAYTDNDFWYEANEIDKHIETLKEQEAIK